MPMCHDVFQYCFNTRRLCRHLFLQVMLSLTVIFKVTQHEYSKVRKTATIRNRYDHVPHLTQYTNGKVTHSQLDITNESQEVSPFTAGDHKASNNRRTRMHNKHKTETT